MSKLSAEEITCIRFMDKLQDALNNHCFIDVTNLRADGVGCDYTRTTNSIDFLGFKYSDQFEGWVSNNLQSLNVMEGILNPPAPHSSAFIAQQNITKALYMARKHNYFIDVTNLKDDGTGYIPIDRDEVNEIMLSHNHRDFYTNESLRTYGSDSRLKLDCRVRQMMFPLS